MTAKRRSLTGRGLLGALPLLATLLLVGCPYSSDQPLADPSAAAVDPGLLGAWRTRDADTGEWHRITFLRFDEHEMVACAPGDSPGEISVSRMFLTAIGDERFLNFRELGSEDEPWHFARCRISGDRCELRFIDDGLFDSRTFGSPEDRREFIRAHLADPLLYAPEGEEPWETILERVRLSD